MVIYLLLLMVSLMISASSRSALTFQNTKPTSYLCKTKCAAKVLDFFDYWEVTLEHIQWSQRWWVEKEKLHLFVASCLDSMEASHVTHWAEAVCSDTDWELQQPRTWWARWGGYPDPDLDWTQSGMEDTRPRTWFTEAVVWADEYILTFVTFTTGHTSASFHTETNF